MIRKYLLLMYKTSSDEYKQMSFTSWKKLHMFLFENDLFPEFQVNDIDGKELMHYTSKFVSHAKQRRYYLTFTEDVPGSILFEIVNKHASAQLN